MLCLAYLAARQLWWAANNAELDWFNHDRLYAASFQEVVLMEPVGDIDLVPEFLPVVDGT